MSYCGERTPSNILTTDQSAKKKVSSTLEDVAIRWLLSHSQEEAHLESLRQVVDDFEPLHLRNLLDASIADAKRTIAIDAEGVETEEAVCQVKKRIRSALREKHHDIEDIVQFEEWSKEAMQQMYAEYETSLQRNSTKHGEPHESVTRTHYESAPFDPCEHITLSWRAGHPIQESYTPRSRYRVPFARNWEVRGKQESDTS